MLERNVNDFADTITFTSSTISTISTSVCCPQQTIIEEGNCNFL